MKLAEIEDRLAQIDVAAGQDLIYELLAAYGTPQSSITKLRTGTYNKSGAEDTVLWKKKVWDVFVPAADDDQLLTTLDRAQANNDIGRLKPRFYIARNERRLAAVDSRLGQTLDIALTDLPRHAAFFMPWAGAEKVRAETASYVDTKVAQQMAKLYDEILAVNPELPATDDGRRNLNHFFTRLLFCFFAEDTGVFPDGIFTTALNNLTATDGSDTADFLDQLFTLLDTPKDDRGNVPSHFEPFDYVNGSLFSDRIAAPTFSRRARNIVVDCGTLDWSSINPDIFGSMIQAVVSTDDRANLGMHYTSVENILKVLNPLFLDDLEERFHDAVDSVRKLEDLLDHLGDIRVFDPACGSGNFLIVAYKRLRSLEHRLLERLTEIDSFKAALFAESKISLANFYGIEIDDFAHDIAQLSLWFAKHQMNVEYDELFGIERRLIPLTESGTIHCANATRVDWTEVCEPTAATFVCGNPPYVGSSMQTASQKGDMAAYFGTPRYPKNLDYIGLWFLKAADWLQGSARVGFVSTNSICQGTHVAMLWERMLEKDVSIAFAHTSFLWSNEAKGNAGVTCVVVGLSALRGEALLIDDGTARTVPNINPYLVPSPDNTIVVSRSQANERPKMTRGSMASDGGHLLLSEAQYLATIHQVPATAEFLLPYIGAKELLYADTRYCLWIEDEQRELAARAELLAERIRLVGAFRSRSQAATTRDYGKDHRFRQPQYKDAPCIAVPRHSSERREFVPMALYPAGTVISDANFAVYGAEPWLLASLQSLMHMAWVRSVSGGLENRIRYANTLCYNTFPFPDLDDWHRSELSERALDILAARERWPDRSLAELYDPDKMPANVRAAHEANDAFVDSLYRKKPFSSDADRMELLLAMYRELITAQDKKG